MSAQRPEGAFVESTRNVRTRRVLTDAFANRDFNIGTADQALI